MYQKYYFNIISNMYYFKVYLILNIINKDIETNGRE